MTTIQLSDTQLVILSTACARDDRAIFPITAKLKGGAVGNVCKSLLKRQLIEEMPASDLNTVYRHDEERGPLTLRATEAASEVLGIDDDPPPSGSPAPVGERAAGQVAATEAVTTTRADTPPTQPRKAKSGGEGPAKVAGAATGRDEGKTAKTRSGTKQALLIEMLSRKEGATIAEVAAATGWLPHTVRGAMAGALKKKLGLTIDSEKIEGRGRVYRVAV